MTKFNRLHLHIADSQSFPLLLDDVFDATTQKSIPLSQLAMKGSFDNSSKFYTKDEIRDLVIYAEERGLYRSRPAVLF
jgi:N-acetyl-beta-hexosaminidase